LRNISANIAALKHVTEVEEVEPTHDAAEDFPGFSLSDFLAEFPSV